MKVNEIVSTIYWIYFDHTNLFPPDKTLHSVSTKVIGFIGKYFYCRFVSLLGKNYTSTGLTEVTDTRGCLRSFVPLMVAFSVPLL